MWFITVNDNALGISILCKHLVVVYIAIRCTLFKVEQFQFVFISIFLSTFCLLFQSPLVASWLIKDSLEFFNVCYNF